MLQMPGYGGYSGMGYGMMGYGGSIIGWTFMILFLAALVLAIIWLYKQVKGEEKEVLEKPLDILKKRYAAGEITKEQFEEMKKDIG